MENKGSQQILPKEELKAKVEKAHQVIHDLCQGKREWIMSIPADRETDPDLILNDTLMLLEERVKQLEEESKNHKAQMEWLSQEYPEIREKLPYAESLQFGFITRNEAQRIQGENNKIFAQHIKALKEENTRLKELLPDCWYSGEIKGDYKACVTLSKTKGNEILHPGEDHYPNFEDWCKKNNINL